MGLPLIIRNEKPRLLLTQLKDRLKRSSTKNAEIILVGTLLLFMLMGGSLFSLFQELELLQEEKRGWTEVVLNAPKEALLEIAPRVEDLPIMIDQCVKIFEQEDAEIRTFNLERFGEGAGNQTSYINYALVRFTLKGTWEGLRNGIETIESLPKEAIRVQEAQLNSSGGEILLKIYFREPDNPLKP